MNISLNLPLPSIRVVKHQFAIANIINGSNFVRVIKRMFTYFGLLVKIYDDVFSKIVVITDKTRIDTAVVRLPFLISNRKTIKRMKTYIEGEFLSA